MICNKCGNNLEDGARFCYKCGAVMDDEVNQPINPNVVPSNMHNEGAGKSRSNEAKILVIVLSIVGVLTIVLVAILFGAFDKTIETSSTADFDEIKNERLNDKDDEIDDSDNNIEKQDVGLIEDKEPQVAKETEVGEVAENTQEEDKSQEDVVYNMRDSVDEQMLLGVWQADEFYDENLEFVEYYDGRRYEGQLDPGFELWADGVLVLNEGTDDYYKHWSVDGKDISIEFSSEEYFYYDGKLFEKIEDYMTEYYDFENSNNVYMAYKNIGQSDSTQDFDVDLYEDYIGYWYGGYMNKSGQMLLSIEIAGLGETSDELVYYVDAYLQFAPDNSNTVAKSGAYQMYGFLDISTGEIYLEGVEWISVQPEGYEMLDLFGHISADGFFGKFVRDYLKEFELYR